MSQSGFFRWFLTILLFFCLTASGILPNSVMAAGKDKDPNQPKADIRTRIATQTATKEQKAVNEKTEPADNKSDSKTEPEPKPEPKPKPELKPKPEPKPEPKPKPELKPKPEPKPKLEPKPEPKPKSKPELKPAPNPVPLPKVSGATVATNNKSGITAVRWSSTIDAISGEETFRIVLDTSSAVKVQDELIDGFPPKLSVLIKGVKPGDLGNVDFDGKIVKKAIFSADGKDTKIVFDLASVIDKTGYKVFTLRKNIEPGKPFRVVIDITKPVLLPEFFFTPGLKDKVIVIDPGHGGGDSGAVGPSKIMEKNVTLAVSKFVKEFLEKEDARVVLTRSTDRDVAAVGASDVEELGARVNVANFRKADIFISIHADSFTNKTVGGSSTYYYKKTVYDVMLAKTLQNRLLQAGKLQDRGAKPSNFYVVKHTRMPATLVELAFMSNPNEERLLNSPEFQKKMAKGIVDGIKDFFDQAAKLRGEE